MASQFDADDAKKKGMELLLDNDLTKRLSGAIMLQSVLDMGYDEEIIRALTRCLFTERHQSAHELIETTLKINVAEEYGLAA
jgi:hypothetical protein